MEVQNARARPMCVYRRILKVGILRRPNGQKWKKSTFISPPKFLRGLAEQGGSAGVVEVLGVCFEKGGATKVKSI